MSTDTTLVVEHREELGKNSNKRTRAAGMIPGVVYGGGRDPLTIQVASRKIQKLLRDGGDNAVFLLQLEGTDQSRHTMVKEIQVNHVTGSLVHLDFQRVDMTERVQVNVPVELIGIPEGVKTDGGIVDFINREIEISCLPGDIPEHLEVDVTALGIGSHLEAGEVPLGEGLELLDDPKKVLASVKMSRLEEEPEEEEEVEGDVEGEVEGEVEAGDSDSE